ncbi:kti12, chromatin associated [Desmophyllum pertusum]|uniref:Protein KTI12 homolog n=1 Tax=Desmophyllum pertusum TaxID=174260 RepID=A0A9X0A664_9CNID|nr:kti12, chromatin associated [Desmophyllum pertusum]
MPLVVMCGYPCSGKSKRAHELKNHLENSRGKTVHLAGDECISLERNVVYAASSNEKEARGLLKSAVERLISRDDIIILDSLNYIKGYRYELYCVAKAHKTTHCIVHCDTPKETCREWNRTRETRYNDEILDALVMRFEPPESRNRWDSPLFVIQVDDDLPLDNIYDALINRIPPPPNQATQAQPLSATNFLYELDKTTQEIVAVLLNCQRTFVPGDHVAVPGTSEKISFYIKLILTVKAPFFFRSQKSPEGRVIVKQVSNKLKTICPSQKKNIGQVLSIVSSVDLTLRFTHSKISSLEKAAKRLNKVNTVLLNRLGKMDRKLDALTKMIRKVTKEDKPKSVTVCESKKATITCKKGKKIEIVQANYGRLNKRTCRKSPVTNCRAAKSLALVQSTCHKKARCVLRASNNVFGDPCKGVAKYLLVKYKCGQ